MHYGAIHALKGIDVEVNWRDRHADRLERCWQTTTMYTTAGILKPSAGRITFEGEDVTKFDAPHMVKRGICLFSGGQKGVPRN